MVKLVLVDANNVYPEQFEHLNSNKDKVTYITAVKFYIGCKPMIGQVANVFTNQPFCVGYLICHWIIPNLILVLQIHTRHLAVSQDNQKICRVNLIVKRLQEDISLTMSV